MSNIWKSWKSTVLGVGIIALGTFLLMGEHIEPVMWFATLGLGVALFLGKDTWIDAILKKKGVK